MPVTQRSVVELNTFPPKVLFCDNKQMWHEIRISKRWDPRPETGNHFMGETREPRPGILMVGPETLKVGPGALIVGETKDPKQSSLDEH